VSEGSHCKMTRRTALQAGLIMVAAGVSGRAAAQQKIAQNLVQYQTTPKNGAQCDQCLQWSPPDACKVVDGKILPTGWCAAFAPKPK
jgi:hypothetical protein